LLGVFTHSDTLAFMASQKITAAGQTVQKFSLVLQGKELRRVVEEFRDTKDDRRAEELKKIISDSMLGRETRRLI
jgi:hypothetical protein